MLDELFQFVLDNMPAEKNIYDLLETELINYCVNSKYEMMTFEMFYELKRITHKEKQKMILPDIIIDKENRNIKFELGQLKGYYLCGARYYDDSVTKLYAHENIINYGDTGYVVVYLMSDVMLYRSGFVLIDCENNTYTYSPELIDKISKGVVKS